MPVPFGIGIGDFIAVVGLAKDICDALRSQHGAAAQYRSVIAILDSLSDALEHLQKLESGDDALLAALDKAVSRFKESIADFIDKNKRYKSLLQAEGSVSKWRASMGKVRWALFDGRDITAFYTEITAHAMSVLILVSTAQTGITNTHSQKVSRVDEELRQIQSLQLLLNENLRHWAEELLGVLSKLVQINLALFGSVAGFHRLFTTRAPPEIGAGPIVNFQDASGSIYPIHLKTIDTWEAFEDVLKHQYRSKPGLSAILSARYMLQDATTYGSWKPINMNAAFESVFKPDHKIDMTMIFNYDPDTETECPKCGRPEDQILNKSKLECSAEDCDLCYQKSSWKDTWVTSLPVHFDANLSESTCMFDSNNPRTSYATPDLPNSNLEVEPPKFVGSAPRAESAERIFDFKNVFIARPANVAIRASSGSWHLFPWRLVKNAEGMKFALDNFIKPGTHDVPTTLREIGKDVTITESTLSSQLQPGMSIEAFKFAPPKEQTPSYLGQQTKLTSLLPFETTRCLLCGIKLRSRVAFERHLQCHIRRRPCPNACDICLRTPADAFSCLPDCTCSPIHKGPYAQLDTPQSNSSMLSFSKRAQRHNHEIAAPTSFTLSAASRSVSAPRQRDCLDSDSDLQDGHDEELLSSSCALGDEGGARYSPILPTPSNNAYASELCDFAWPFPDNLQSSPSSDPSLWSMDFAEPPWQAHAPSGTNASNSPPPPLNNVYGPRSLGIYSHVSDDLPHPANLSSPPGRHSTNTSDRRSEMSEMPFAENAESSEVQTPEPRPRQSTRGRGRLSATLTSTISHGSKRKSAGLDLEDKPPFRQARRARNLEDSGTAQPNATRRAGSWWTCHQCHGTMNSTFTGNLCTTCEHSRCDSCYTAGLARPLSTRRDDGPAVLKAEVSKRGRGRRH